MKQTMNYDKLAPLQERFPVGTKVRITVSDVPEYVGALGEVVDYDPGYDQFDTPLVGVRFTPPLKVGLSEILRDGFYDDEIVKLENENDFDKVKYAAGKRLTKFDEDRSSVLACVRRIESAMHEICELAQKNNDINSLICEAYPFKESLEEAACHVNAWWSVMDEVKLDV